MSLISVNNLTFGYDGSLDNVFENISFNIDTNWKIGLIGRNGKGKTTFLKLLLGKYEHEGTISKNIEFDYFPFEVPKSNKTSIEIIKEIAVHAKEWEIRKELSLLNCGEDILYMNYDILSMGQKTKILLLSLFLKENNFLLIDEPTNHLDIETRDNLASYLKEKNGFIIVSHDRHFLDKVVDHIAFINNTHVEVQKGNFSSWKENKDRQDSFEIMQNEKLEKDITRLSVASKNIAGWSSKTEKSKYKSNSDETTIDRGYVGHKSAKIMKRSKATKKRIERKLEEKSSLLKNIDKTDSLKIIPLEKLNRDNLIIFKDFCIKYDEKRIFKNISFEVKNKDRVAVVGKNGIGKSSILKVIIGENIKYDGYFKMVNGLKISYISQSIDSLRGNLRQFALENNLDEGVFKAMLSKMGFSKTDFDIKIENMSDGQKKKVLISKSISESADIYVWDEPLNYIDVLTRIEIEEAILKYMPTLIFVEHDEMFIKNIATKVVNLEE